MCPASLYLLHYFLLVMIKEAGTRLPSSRHKKKLLFLFVLFLSFHFFLTLQPVSFISSFYIFFFCSLILFFLLKILLLFFISPLYYLLLLIFLLSLLLLLYFSFTYYFSTCFSSYPPFPGCLLFISRSRTVPVLFHASLLSLLHVPCSFFFL